MTDLDHYLAQHYLDDVQLAKASAMAIEEIDALISAQLAPAPAYVVSDDGVLHSHVFGAMAAPGAKAGRFFHPSHVVWITLARQALARGHGDAAAHLRQGFIERFATALATLNLTTLRLRDSFRDDGTPIADGLKIRTDNAWKFFLNGTFALCVANPISEAQIAYKEVLQEKLAQQSENGLKTRYTSAELPAMQALIDAYAAAAMPFSPIEYTLSSRKRLVEDLRAAIHATT
jgi:hypothetical protein